MSSEPARRYLMASPGSRPSHRTPVWPFLREAAGSAPLAVAGTMALELAVAVAGAVLAPRTLTGTAVLCAVVSTTIWCVALAARSQRAFVAALLFLSAACALSALPVHRGISSVVAAVGGAAAVVFAETGGHALERLGAPDHAGRPSLLRVAWVAPVAVLGAGAGWLLLSFEPALSGFGLAAVGVGVVAAICLVALAAVLSGTAVAPTREE